MHFGGVKPFVDDVFHFDGEMEGFSSGGGAEEVVEGF